jgi:allantoicase
MVTDKPDFTDRYVDLAQPRLGAKVLEASDDFFAPKERLIDPAEPVFIPGKYDDHGKWMDGWESRRKRVPGHDYCILRLCAGTIHGVDIDTRHFTGNYPPHASIDICHIEGRPDEHTRWRPLIPKTALQGDSHHYLEIQDRGVWTHARLNIYPDGGVARLRVYGVAHHDWNRHSPGEWVDLAAMKHGGRALDCNDMHFGHMSNLIAPGQGIDMGDGWETRRRREPGNDWVILKLGRPGTIRRVEVDTSKPVHPPGRKFYPPRNSTPIARIASRICTLMPASSATSDSTFTRMEALAVCGCSDHGMVQGEAQTHPPGAPERICIFTIW